MKETDPANLAGDLTPAPNAEKGAHRGIDKTENSGAAKLFCSTKAGGGSKGSADPLGGSGRMAGGQGPGAGPAGDSGSSATEKDTKASEWQAVVDPASGMTYYHNTKTGVTQWTDPAAEQKPPSTKVSPELLLYKFLVTNNLEAYSQHFEDRGITVLDPLHELTKSEEPRAAFLSLGQECGMSTIETSRLFKAAKDSAIQAEKDANEKAAAKAKAKAERKAKRHAEREAQRKARAEAQRKQMEEQAALEEQRRIEEQEALDRVLEAELFPSSMPPPAPRSPRNVGLGTRAAAVNESGVGSPRSGGTGTRTGVAFETIGASEKRMLQGTLGQGMGHGIKGVRDQQTQQRLQQKRLPVGRQNFQRQHPEAQQLPAQWPQAQPQWPQGQAQAQPQPQPTGFGQPQRRASMGPGLGNFSGGGQGLMQGQATHPSVAPIRRKPVRRSNTIQLGMNDPSGVDGGGGGGGGDLSQAMATTVNSPHQLSMYSDVDQARGW